MRLSVEGNRGHGYHQGSDDHDSQLAVSERRISDASWPVLAANELIRFLEDA